MRQQRVRPAQARRSQPPARRGSLLSTVVTAAVTAVVVASGLTAYLLQRADSDEAELAVLEPLPDMNLGTEMPRGTPGHQNLVTAPPLSRVLRMQARPMADDGAPQATTQVMGAAPACANCGVVETVVAVHEYGQARARGYQMHIRMDDGTVRTVQHRGALAAGSRVAVEGEKLRPLAAP